MTSDNNQFDIVISGGRVMDPESGLDAVRNIGISNGTIGAITEDGISGNETINAGGLVVSPGFIDLHTHGQDRENYDIQAMDGVTTTLELEVGVADVDRWYAERDGDASINFGASIGHIPVRMEVMLDPGDFLPSGDAAHREATNEEIEEMKRLLVRGLERGALAMGFGMAYTPSATRWEIVEMFKIAAEFGTSCHVHLRGKGHREPMGAVETLEEVIAAAAVTGASAHVVHIQSTGTSVTPNLLEMIEGARARGLDITTECYPYTASQTRIESAQFDDGWQERFGISYDKLQWPETGEFLNVSTFAQYREEGGWVIAHATPETAVRAAVASPLTIIGSDGIIRDGKGHPRTSGSFSLVLGRFVRESGALSLMNALKKMTLMPAQRLEKWAPAFENKGRIKVGADADIAIFDANRIIDRSTYDQPTLPPEGMEHVIVKGTPVVSNAKLVEGVSPGQGIRAPIR